MNSPFRHEFEECPECAAKPGSPTLCPSCLHNREIIEDLYNRLSAYGKKFGVIRAVMEL